MKDAAGIKAWFTKTPCVAAFGVGGALFILLGSCLGWAYLPGLLDRKVVEKVVLVDDSPAFERWRSLPQPLVTKFYLFNVTNPDEVQNGARPVLNELGPYVYDEHIERVDIVKNQDGETVSYNLKSTFFFNQELSGNKSTSDSVTIINLPLLGTALKVKKYFPFALKLMQPILGEIFPYSGSIFLTGTVAQLLFEGMTVVDCSNTSTEIAEMVCDQLETQMPETVERTDENTYKFSFYHYKNGTSKARYTVDRGVTDSKRLAQVVAYDGKDRTDAWQESRCNLVNGTDGIFFSPLRNSDDPLVVFSSDVCRSVTLKFERKSQFRGLPVLRYVNDPALLGDPEKYPDNKCYCVGRSNARTCLKGGVLDLSPCIGVAVILSYPHLYMADPEYLQYAEGISPDRRKHQTFLEVEPRTGIPLQGSRKVQLNMFLTRIPEVSVLSNVSEGLFPAMWMDEGIEVNDKNLVLLHSLNNMVNTFYTTRWMAIILGLALCVAACMGLYSRKKNCGSYDNRIIPFEKQGALNMAFVNDDGIKPTPPPDVTKASPPFHAVVDNRRGSAAGDTTKKESSTMTTEPKREESPCYTLDPSKKDPEGEIKSRSPTGPEDEAQHGNTNPPETKDVTTMGSHRNSTVSTNVASPPEDIAHASGATSRHPSADSNSSVSSAEDTKSTTSLRSVEEAKGPGSNVASAKCTDGEDAR